MNPFSHTGLSISDSLKSVRKSVLIYETIIECWARNQCGLCYDNAISADGDSLYVSGKLCQTSRELVRDMFINYFRIFEKDREGLAKAVKNIKIK